VREPLVDLLEGELLDDSLSGVPLPLPPVVGMLRWVVSVLVVVKSAGPRYGRWWPGAGGRGLGVLQLERGRIR
jgi:hypothetical protein